nr:hypothetical protein [Tanacetum cinerariifolium]
MLVTMGEGSGTPTEPHHTPSPKAQQTSPTATSSPSLSYVTNSLALSPVADEPASPIGDDSQGRSLDEGEEADVDRSTERGSDDTKEMVNVLTSLDIASILTSGVPVTKVFVAEVPTGSGSIPTASLIFTTATVATPYLRRKGKEKMVESETPKKKKL